MSHIFKHNYNHWTYYNNSIYKYNWTTVYKHYNNVNCIYDYNDDAYNPMVYYKNCTHYPTK